MSETPFIAQGQLYIYLARLRKIRNGCLVFIGSASAGLQSSLQITFFALEEMRVGFVVLS